MFYFRIILQMFKTDGMYASIPFLKIIITFILRGLHVKYVHGSLQGIIQLKQI